MRSKKESGPAEPSSCGQYGTKGVIGGAKDAGNRRAAGVHAVCGIVGSMFSYFEDWSASLLTNEGLTNSSTSMLFGPAI